ncbi:MAG: glycosyltransferase family 2 protein, partial [Candidatus Omnitrophica bacterium]|nr:glycosyltransferase family 2 protein [Candidatus Omnitrophota bacterium]
AFNEEYSLAGLLKDIKAKGLSVLAIDDGSIDNTFTVAQKWADVCLHNIKNLGKGISLRKAIAYLLEEKDFDYIITMDGDGQHSVSDLSSFIEKAEKGVSFVVGNRMDNPSNMPKTRVVTNKFMSWLLSKIAHQKIPDSQCGYRLIKRDVLEKIIISTKKYEIESEMLIKAARLGFTIESVPIKSIYTKNLRSKINPFVDTIRFIKFISGLNNDHQLKEIKKNNK